MVIGDSKKYIVEDRLKKRIISTIGTHDLHAHLRIRPLITFIKQKCNDKCINILEIGCGNGINGFEIFKCNNNIKYYGFDLNLKSINKAKSIANKMGCKDKIKFYYEDAIKAKFNLEEKFDIILLMDFLEHIEDPETFLKRITHLFDEKTIIIVSVPTYRYKNVFGTEFHTKAGHVKDGYNLKELSKLFEKIDYKIDYYSFNTGYISNIGCFIYYNDLKNKYFNFLKTFLVYPFKFLDIYNSEKVSCTLFTVLSRRNKNI